MKSDENIKLEIQHIFDSGANEIRIFNMVKSFLKADRQQVREMIENMLKENEPIHHNINGDYERGRYSGIKNRLTELLNKLQELK